MRLCRVVPADHSDLVVLLEHRRVIKDARGHPDNVVLLVGGLSAVAVDGLRLANQLTGGIIIQSEINAANVEVPAKRKKERKENKWQGQWADPRERGGGGRQDKNLPHRIGNGNQGIFCAIDISAHIDHGGLLVDAVLWQSALLALSDKREKEEREVSPTPRERERETMRERERELTCGTSNSMLPLVSKDPVTSWI